MILAIYFWIGGVRADYKRDPTWDWFSSNYTAILIFIVICLVCSKKDIRIFMKIGSFGVIFVVMLMIFIVYTGIKSLTDTNYSIGTTAESDATDWTSDSRTLVLFNSGYP